MPRAPLLGRQARPVRVFCFFLLLSLLAAPALARTLAPATSGWVVVFDAGSTGTRAHVYSYSRGPGSALPRVEAVGAAAKAGPLSAETPSTVGALLAPLIAAAVAALPPSAAGSTDAIFLATAGLRALPRPTAQALVDAAAGALRSSSPFTLRRGGAAILAGADEAALAWAAANAASGALAAPSSSSIPSTGIVELGGASLQVAFEVARGGRASTLSPPDRASVGTLELAAPPLGGGRRGRAPPPVTLYARSFEGLGHEAAAAAAGVGGGRGGGGPDRPCAPPADVPAGVGDDSAAAGDAPTSPFGRCKAAATTALAAACGHGEPTAPHCPLPRHAGAAGRPPPRLEGVRLLGLENLAHTAAFLGVGGAGGRGGALGEVAAAGARLCARGGAGLAGRAGAPPAEAARHCFGAAYAVALLHDAFGVGLASPALDLSGKVAPPGGGTPVSPDWAAGAALVAASGGSAGSGSHPFAGGVLRQQAEAAATGRRRHHSRLGRVLVLAAAGVGFASLSGAAWPGAAASAASRAAGRVHRSLRGGAGAAALLPGSSGRWGGGGGVSASSSTGSLRGALSRRGGGEELRQVS